MSIVPKENPVVFLWPPPEHLYLTEKGQDLQNVLFLQRLKEFLPCLHLDSGRGPMGTSSMLKNIEVVADAWPIVVIRYGRFSDDEHAEHLNQILEVLDEHVGPFGALLNLQSSVPLNSVQRRRTADFWNEHRDVISTRLAAVSYVTDNGLMRGVITALNWFIRYPCPNTVQATPEDALPWIQQHLDDKRS